MKPIMFAIHNSIETIHPPPGCLLLECKEVSHFLDAVSCNNLSYYCQHSSRVSVFLRFEKYGEYFSSAYPFFYHISKERHTHVPRRSLSFFLASLPLLYSASSAPALMSRSSGRPCARSRYSSCPPSGDSSLLGGTLNYFSLILHRIQKYTFLTRSLVRNRQEACSPCPLNRDMPPDVCFKLESNKGKMDPKLKELESSSAGTGLETP